MLYSRFLNKPGLLTLPWLSDARTFSFQEGERHTNLHATVVCVCLVVFISFIYVKELENVSSKTHGVL